MYWKHTTGGWQPAAHVTWYEWGRTDSSENAVHVTRMANQSRVAWCQNIPPVAFPNLDNWTQTSSGFMMPAAAIQFVRQLNLLRYQFRSQAI
jgi:hypothetical protein